MVSMFLPAMPCFAHYRLNDIKIRDFMDGREYCSKFLKKKLFTNNTLVRNRSIILGAV